MLYRGNRVTPEGWEFHISAHPHNAEVLAEVVLPLLTRMDVLHKYLELYNSIPESATSRQIHRVLTGFCHVMRIR